MAEDPRGGGENPPEQHDDLSGEAQLERQPEATENRRAPATRGPKRRTKTGCLTCRKRRIKCGEEKPRCNNCIKAKRDCEGYTQRVVFKNALGPFGAAYDPAVPANLQNPVTPFPRQAQAQAQPQQQQSHHQQPRQIVSGQALNPQQRLLAPRLPREAAAPPLQPVPSHLPPESVHYPSYSQQPPSWQHGQYHSQSPPSFDVNRHASHSQPNLTSGQATYLPQTLGNNNNPYRGGYNVDGPSTGIPGTATFNPALVPIHHSRENFPGPMGQRYQADQGLAQSTRFFTDNTFEQVQGYAAWNANEQAFPAQYSPEEVEDDYDYYYDDLDSDNDQLEATEEEGFNQLNLIAASAQQEAIRSYNTFLNEPNILASYQPSLGSSPLNNPKTARIWVHFIHATAPSLSIWERHNTNATTLFSGPVPPSGQGLWTYVMPLKALNHPALLQVILAMSSLHIAKLQQNHFTVTFKHYQYALRKISKAVGSPLRRKQVATLAATLLLAFYEVTAGEHTKWDSHVAGAAQLIKEIDFVGVTKDLRAYRRSLQSQRQQWWGSHDAFAHHAYTEDDSFADKESGVDANIISAITGRAVDYDQIGHVDIYPRLRRKHFTRKDIENFRLQCDLYWWYCKQDLYQSLISGNRLHTPYERWDQCPPRAGLGKIDALYGSFDHLVLLMARMMDFGYRDRKRKLKSYKASGGDWRPQPAFFKFLSRFGPKKPPSEMPTRPPTSGNAPGPSESSKQPPPNRHTDEKPMYGLMPARSPSAAPAAFTSMGESPPYSTSFDDDRDEDMTMNDAEAEWESILAAYQLFESQLGEALAPLPADTVVPVESPFGMALQYRSHKIAVLWGYYYAGRIMLNRLHPSMPPAAMVAAGASASTCAHYAQTIGRIAAGLYFPQIDIEEIGRVNPNLGAAWIEVTVNLYVAAIQYTDAAQRSWTATTLRKLARLSGWQSAETIASGCEAAWTRMAKAGRGPPYNPAQAPAGDPASSPSGQNNQQWSQWSKDSTAERRFVAVERPRARYAMGLLELESDLVDWKLDDPL